MTLRHYSTPLTETTRLPVEFPLHEAQAADAFLRSGQDAPKDVLSLLERVRREYRINVPEAQEAPFWDEAYNGVGE